MENNISFPLKLYRLGQNPMTVNSTYDMDFWMKDGWTITPQVYSFQKFPCVLYHTKLSSKSVKSQEEMDELMKDGWSTSPQKVSELEDLLSQIDYHESEAIRLKSKLDEMYPPEVKDEEVEETATKEEIPVVKKKGRPAKVKE